MVEPLVTMGDRRNIARVLIDAGSIIPGAELSVVYYSPQFAKDKDAATRFMVGYLMGARDYYDAFFLGQGKDAAITMLAQYLPVRDRTLWETSHQYTDVNGKLNVEDIKQQAAFYKAEGLVSGPVPDIEGHVDPTFAAAAAQILGPR
jgi:NitT/TauT family transport system substrate-binding protein